MEKNDINKQLKDGAVIELVDNHGECTTIRAFILKKWEFEHPDIHHLLLYLDTNRIVEGIYTKIADTVFSPDCLSIEALEKNPPKDDYSIPEERCVVIPDLLKRMLVADPKVRLTLAAR
jgi:hypothetical protein